MCYRRNQHIHKKSEGCLVYKWSIAYWLEKSISHWGTNRTKHNMRQLFHFGCIISGLLRFLIFTDKAGFFYGCIDFFSYNKNGFLGIFKHPTSIWKSVKSVKICKTLYKLPFVGNCTNITLEVVRHLHHIVVYLINVAESCIAYWMKE